MNIGQKEKDRSVLETSKVGKRGSVIIPAKLRKQYGIKEGTLIVAEARPEGVLIKPAVAVPIEFYSNERKAEFLLSNAVDSEDYQWAVREVKKLGLDPKKIPHRRPSEK